MAVKLFWYEYDGFYFWKCLPLPGLRAAKKRMIWYWYAIFYADAEYACDGACREAGRLPRLILLLRSLYFSRPTRIYDNLLSHIVFLFSFYGICNTRRRISRGDDYDLYLQCRYSWFKTRMTRARGLSSLLMSKSCEGCRRWAWLYISWATYARDIGA